MRNCAFLRVLTNVVPLVVLALTIAGCSQSGDDRDTGASPAPVSQAGPVLPPGSKLVTENGAGRYLIGVNYPWHRYGDDFGGNPESTEADWAAITKDFSTMHNEGVEVVRLYLFADGRSEPKFNARGYVTGLGPKFLPDLDRMLQIASNDQISLVLTLCDAGMFRFYADPTTHGGGHAPIILESEAQQSFIINALKPIVIHLAASPYRSTVVSIDLMNEPEAVTAGFYAAGGTSQGTMKAFLVVETEYIHKYGNGILVTVGSASPEWVGTWTGIGLDYYSVHYYPSMDSADLLAGTLPAGNGLLPYSQLNLDRPCVLEEFATNDSAYSPTTNKPLSTLWYLNQSRKLGYAGSLGWSYSLHDSASNWKKFAPTYTLWHKKHATELSHPVASS